MSNDDIKEEKKPALKSRESKTKISMYKTFKKKVEGLEEVVFKSGAVKHAAQITKMLEEIAKYVQVKYNSDVA